MSDVKTVVLEIFVQSHSLLSYCYLGFDIDDKRIVRPVRLSDSNQPITIAEELEVGKCYEMTYRPIDQLKLTQYPHKNEDLVVIDIRKVNRECDEPVIDHLKNLAINTLPGDRFVNEGTNCSSAMVLKCSSVNFDDSESKPKVVFECNGHDYRLPYTAKNFPNYENNGDPLVVVSSGRPFAGTGEYEFNPRRCYLLVVAIFK